MGQRVDRYIEHRRKMAAESRKRAKEGRDIGKIPEIVDPRRRARCRRSLRKFCETYNPVAFNMKWGPNHLRVIERIEESVFHGALYALAMPRGEGKTTICRTAVLWAVSYALVQYVFVIGATQKKAEDNLQAVKTWMATLANYVEDFPEISLPAIALGRIANRAGGQLCDEDPTYIEWAKDRVVLATVPSPSNLRSAPKWAPTSGVVIGASGLTGEGLLGSLHTRPSDGAQVRPDFVLLDDPQTDESAASPTQNETREGLISGTVLGMAGPGKRIAAVMPCTVKKPDDMVSRLLDHETHPLWRGERTSMLESMPADMDAWEHYFEVYRRCRTKRPPDITEANEYYRQHQQQLDAGAKASWAERKGDEEVSAIQSAMNLYCRDSVVFWSEFMNRPLDPYAEAGALTSSEVAGKLDQSTAKTIPPGCEHLTAFVDVHDDLLYWVVCAWELNFTGSVAAYGTYPKQVASYFTLRDARKTMRTVAPANASKQAAIVAGVEAQVSELLERTWKREDGVELQIGRLMVDAGYLPKAVRQGLRRVGHPNRAAPSLGRGITAASRPIAEWTYQPGDRRGHYWGHFKDKIGRGRTVIFDASWWKSRVRDGFKTPIGDAGCITLHGRDPGRHRMIGDHCASEVPIATEGQGRKLEEWKLLPGKSDNHWWDCLVGCMVGASMLGCVLPGSQEKPKAKRRVKLSELRNRKRRA